MEKKKLCGIYYLVAFVTYLNFGILHAQHDNLSALLIQDLSTGAHIDSSQHYISEYIDILAKRIDIQFIGVVRIFQHKCVYGDFSIGCLLLPRIPNISVDGIILINPGYTAVNTLAIELQPATHVPKTLLENGQYGTKLGWSNIDQHIAITAHSGDNL